MPVKNYYLKLVTFVEGDPLTPFSIAVAPRRRGGWYSIYWIAHFTLDPYLIILSVKQGGIKYHFLSFWYGLTWDWTLVSSTLANTLLKQKESKKTSELKKHQGWCYKTSRQTIVLDTLVDCVEWIHRLPFCWQIKLLQRMSWMRHKTIWSYLLTPPLGQDMTQGQIRKRSLTGLNSEFSFS